MGVYDFFEAEICPRMATKVVNRGKYIHQNIIQNIKSGGLKTGVLDEENLELIMMV